jgi:hypothetical protein
MNRSYSTLKKKEQSSDLPLFVSWDFTNFYLFVELLGLGRPENHPAIPP